MGPNTLLFNFKSVLVAIDKQAHDIQSPSLISMSRTKQQPQLSRSNIRKSSAARTSEWWLEKLAITMKNRQRYIVRIHQKQKRQMKSRFLITTTYYGIGRIYQRNAEQSIISRSSSSSNRLHQKCVTHEKMVLYSLHQRIQTKDKYLSQKIKP